MAKKELLRDTGERMIPEFHKGNFMYGEHLIRYMAAKDLVKDKVILDIACGSGYGSAMLATSANKVIGVDVDEETIEYAKQYYSASNIDFIVGSGTAIPLEDDTVDVIVTFETIEHIKDYTKFLMELKRVLKNDGFVIMSTPNDLEFSEGNHFHVHQFNFQEFLKLIRANFKYEKSYLQADWVANAILDESLLSSEWEQEMRVINLAPKKSDKSIYFFAIASDQPINATVNPILGVSEHWSRRDIEEAQKLTNDHIRNLEAIIAAKDKSLHAAEAGLEDAAAHIRSITQSKSWKLARVITKLKPKPRTK